MTANPLHRLRPPPPRSWLRLAAIGAALPLLSCGGAKNRYTVDESSYRVQRKSYGASASLAQVERQQSRRMGYATAGAVARDTADSEPSPPPREPAPKPASRGGNYSKRKAPSYHRDRPTKGRYAQNNNANRRVQQIAQKAGSVQNVKREQARAPVVYLGYLRLRVKRKIPAVDAISKLTQDAGGYIQSMSGRTIIVRIPADDFDGVMKEFAAIGEVLQRQVKALDVSRQFTDLGGRLQVALQARERLLALLATVKDVNERLRIVQEVKRLSEQIESYESTLSTLRNLVSYFTLTIDLDVVVSRHRRVMHRSPFPWIRKLQAHYTTIRDGADELKMTPPKGFVLFDEDDDWRAQASDTTVLRAGRLDNEPRGSSKFWLDAVRHEMEGRDEATEKTGTTGRVHWAVLRNKDVRPRYWLVGTLAIEDDLYVIEAFFPNKQAYESHHEAVIKALSTFEAK